MTKEVAKDPDPPPAPAVASCWICLEGGPDEGGQPLMRSCACRGDSAGYGHISCITKYAKSKTEEMLKKESCGKAHRLILTSAWTSCLTCKQNYEGEMGHALCMAFVDSTEHLPESHGFRIMAWVSLASSFANETDFDEAERLYKYILDIARPGTGGRWDGLHVQLYFKLGKIYHFNQKPVKALEYYKKATDCMKDNNLEDTWGVHDAIESIIEQQPDSHVERARRAIERETLRYGEGSKDVIWAKMSLALALLDQEQHLEGLKVGKKAVESAERLLGPEHPFTGNLEELLSAMKQEYLDYLRGGAR